MFATAPSLANVLESSLYCKNRDNVSLHFLSHLEVGIDCLLLSLLSHRFVRAQSLLKQSYIVQLANIIHKRFLLKGHFQNQKIEYLIYLGDAVDSPGTGSHARLKHYS